MSLLHVVSMYLMFVPEAIKISYFVFRENFENILTLLKNPCSSPCYHSVGYKKKRSLPFDASHLTFVTHDVESAWTTTTSQFSYSTSLIDVHSVLFGHSILKPTSCFSRPSHLSQGLTSSPIPKLTEVFMCRPCSRSSASLGGNQTTTVDEISECAQHGDHHVSLYIT